MKKEKDITKETMLRTKKALFNVEKMKGKVNTGSPFKSKDKASGKK